MILVTTVLTERRPPAFNIITNKPFIEPTIRQLNLAQAVQMLIDESDDELPGSSNAHCYS
jgi:hypothetical protein